MKLPWPLAGRDREAEQALRAGRALVRQAQRVVALTGAGISTPSGIPDFRSSASGLWELADPMEVASIWSFRRRPEAFFDWVRPLAETILTAKPNPAHTALARAEQLGYLKAILTQNIDDLHHRAGSRRVLELHGHLREATCMRCHAVVQAEMTLRDFIQTGRLPHCQCGGLLKPNVILFGEMLPHEILQQAQAEAQACDLMLVAGSSLEVMPASDLPMLAKEAGARLVIVNLAPTPLDDEADVLIRADVAKAIPALLA
ncbi:MAG: NAD-dependent deacylase [Anaerolineae bacterium]|nr:NAD-dependent deacylase [Anaerolineae bacterium]